MYFSEFLETCTIGWASFCEGGVGVGKRNAKNAFFFEKFYRGHDLPHPRRPLYTPPVEAPAPAHPDRLHSTGSSADRARCKPDRPQQATHRHTRPNAGHAAQGDRDGGECWTACNVSGKVYNFGRLILSIFIWISFTKSIDNPYIYGYNIISPDKYGLQPH